MKRISYMYTCIPSLWGHRPTPSHCLGHHRPPSWFPQAILYILGGASGNESMYQCRGHRGGFDPWVRKIPRVGRGDPLQFSCLENPTNRGAWWATVLWVTVRYNCGDSMHTGCVCGFPWWFRWWRICLQCRRHSFNPWVGKTLQSSEWQPPPVFLPGESRGQKSLVGYSPQGHRELDRLSDWRCWRVCMSAFPVCPASPVLRSTCPDSRNRDFIGYFMWPIKLFFKVFWISTLCSGFWAITSS